MCRLYLLGCCLGMVVGAALALALRKTEAAGPSAASVAWVGEPIPASLLEAIQ